MNPPFVLIVLFFSCFILSCGSNEVEQIPVEVPPGVTVPEGMVYIPEGEFIFGHREDPRTELGKKVNLPAFLIDRYEVTRGQYKKVHPEFRYTGGMEFFPMILVNFQEASDFCKALGKRLPTEQEWEKAARGTDGRKWPWNRYYEHPNNGFSGFLPERVDDREEWVSPYGVFGMGHNVWEWTADDYDYNGLPILDRGRYKVIRGGLYQTHLAIKFSHTWARNFMDPQARYNFVGFRCAKDSKP